MKYFLKVLFKREYKILILAIVVVAISALLSLSQFALYTNFFSVMKSIPQKILAVEESHADAAVDFNNLSKINQLKAVYQDYKKNGKDSAINLILSQKKFTLILILGLICIGAIIIINFFIFFKNAVLEVLGIRVSNRIRKEVFGTLIHLPSSFYKSNRSGDLITTVVNDINVIKLNTATLVNTVFFSALMVAVGLTILFYMNSEFAFILIGFGLVIAVLITLISQVLKKVVSEARKDLSNISDLMSNIIYGIDIVKIFNREKFEIERFEKSSDHFAQKSLKERFLLLTTRPITETFGAIAVIGILLYGASLLWRQRIELDEIIAFIILLVMVAPHFQECSRVFNVWQSLSVSVERLRRILNEKIEVHTPALRTFANSKGNVDFENVSFSYPGKTDFCLTEVSFSVKSGEMIAFVGPSGCGKSTLINLLARFVLPTNGKIKFDNIDIASAGIDDTRSILSLVSQETILFPGTIKDNLQYGNLDATFEEIVEAAKIASIHDFIMGTQNKYETLLGERGLTLSGGQKQRLGIARAILKKPTILLLDEATSALDSQSEKSVQEAIENLIDKQTTFVVAHRLSTIKKASRIFVLNQGKIIQQGTYAELLQEEGMFRELHHLQSVSS